MYIQSCHHQLNLRTLLPPAYVVRGKVIFILENVCLFTIGGGGVYPVPGPGGGEYRIPGLDGGGGGYPIPGLDRGVPHPADGGYPPDKDWMGYPLARMGWGTPPTRTGWGTSPQQGLDGVNPPPPSH